MNKVVNQGGGRYSFYCPGCQHDHVYYTQDPDPKKWTFNGNLQSPTFTPSLLNTWGKEADPNWIEPEDIAPDEPGSWSGRCHLFVTNGEINFCGDCTHNYSGAQHVPMREYPQ